MTGPSSSQGRCRACLRECTVGVTLFESNQNLVEALESLVRIQITNEADFPKILCAECHRQLYKSHLFIKITKESHKILYNAYNKSQANNSEENLSLRIFPEIDEMCQFDVDTFLSKNSYCNDTLNCEALIKKCKKSSLEIGNVKIADSVENDMPLIKECDIKQEIIDDSYYNEDNLEEHSLSVCDIKIEPLSENDALKFYQESEFIGKSEVNGDRTQDSNHVNENIGKDLLTIINQIDDLNDSKNRKSLKMVTKEDLNCSECGKSFINKRNLWRHMSTHENAHKCVLCNGCFKTESRLKKHVILHHSYVDPSLDTSAEYETPPSRLMCILCYEKFPTAQELSQHLSEHREIVVLKTGNVESTLCSMCYKEFTNPNELVYHVRHVCRIPPILKSFSESSSFESEYKSIAEEHDYIVSSAARPKKTKKNYLNGENTDETFSCPHCPKLFISKYFLTVHLCQHSSSDSITCAVCSRKFGSKSHLNRHIRTVHNLK